MITLRCSLRRLAVAVATASFFLSIVPAQGPPPGRGPSKDSKWIVKPDTIYFHKNANEAVLTRVINIRRTGPPAAGPAAATAGVTNISGGAWLAAGPVTNGKLTLTATPGSLGPGLYEAQVTVTPTGGDPQTVQAFLRIGPGGPGGGVGPAQQGFFVRPASLKFRMRLGGAAPEPRVLALSNVPAAWNATAMTTPPGGGWLQVNPASGAGNGQANVTVNGTGLGAGLYTGNIRVTSGGSTVDVPVTLEILSASEQGEEARLLVVHPKALNFIVHPDAPEPGPKTVEVKTTRDTPVNWTASVESDGGWLLPPVPAAGATPGSMQVSVNVGTLARGHYEGRLRVTGNGVTEIVRVFLRIVGPPTGVPGLARRSGPSTSAVRISPGVLEFSSGGPAAAATSRQVQLDSGTPGLSFTASASTARGGPWLSLLTTSGGIPGTLNVSVNPGTLAAGVYTGLITINITGPVTERRYVLVILRVGATAEEARLNANPRGVVFQGVAGGASPAPVQVQLEARGAASIPFQASAQIVTGGSWLTVTPSAGTAPATVTLTPNIAGLAAGTYQATVVFQATGSPGAVPATLNVVLALRAGGTTGVALTVAQALPGLRGFFVEPGPDFLATLNVPVPVRVALFRPDGRPAEGLQVRLVSSGEEPVLWLDDAGNGIYTGLFRPLGGGPVSLAGQAFDATGTAVAEFSLGGDVESADDLIPAIFAEGVVSTASFAAGASPLAPGSVASLFGRELVETTAIATMPLPTDLAGVRVLVGGIEAPLIAAVSGEGYDQINFQIPYELAGSTHADIIVLSNGRYSGPQGISLAPAVPALFTFSQRGIGLAAALHADFSPITEERPARPGETVLLFGTGLGAVTPPAATGQPAFGLTALTGSLSVTIGGRAAPVRYAGLAPGFVGLYQINADVPQGASGQAEVRIAVDGISSEEGVVLPVR